MSFYPHTTYKLMLMSLSAHMFFCFYPWTYLLNVLTSINKPDDFFSIVVPISQNLFWKICPLIGQILITCLKCSMNLLLLSSYIAKRFAGNEIGAWPTKKYHPPPPQLITIFHNFHHPPLTYFATPSPPQKRMKKVLKGLSKNWVDIDRSPS